MKRRTIKVCILIACCFLFFIGKKQHVNAAEKRYGNYIYEVINNKVTITGYYYKGKENKLTIPSIVWRLHNNVFHGSKLTSIVIPDSVNDIGSRVFAFTKNLKNLKLSSNVGCYPEDMLYNSGIQKIVLPEGIDIIATNFCRGCSKLVEVVIPSTFKGVYNLIAIISRRQ